MKKETKKKVTKLATADTLRSMLWDSMEKLHKGEITNNEAYTMACGAREYMRVIKEQRVVAQLTKSIPSKGFLDFYQMSAVEAEQKVIGGKPPEERPRP